MVVVFQSDRAGNDFAVFSYQNNLGSLQKLVEIYFVSFGGMIDAPGHCGIQSKISLPSVVLEQESTKSEHKRSLCPATQ